MGGGWAEVVRRCGGGGRSGNLSSEFFPPRISPVVAVAHIVSRGTEVSKQQQQDEQQAEAQSYPLEVHTHLGSLLSSAEKQRAMGAKSAREE